MSCKTPSKAPKVLVESIRLPPPGGIYRIELASSANCQHRPSAEGSFRTRREIRKRVSEIFSESRAKISNASRAKRHINIKHHPENPQVGSHPENSLYGIRVVFLKINEKRHPHIKNAGSRIFMLGAPSILYVGIVNVLFSLPIACQVEEFPPKMSPTNQIAPKNFTTHFCRHGHLNESTPGPLQGT